MAKRERQKQDMLSATSNQRDAYLLRGSSDTYKVTNLCSISKAFLFFAMGEFVSRSSLLFLRLAKLLK